MPMALVCLGLGRLWAHPFSSLILVTVAAVRNHLLGQLYEPHISFNLRDPVMVRIPKVTPPSGSVGQYERLPSQPGWPVDRGDQGGHASRSSSPFYSPFPGGFRLSLFASCGSSSCSEKEGFGKGSEGITLAFRSMMERGKHAASGEVSRPPSPRRQRLVPTFGR
jgi:hypothetical protein